MIIYLFIVFLSSIKSHLDKTVKCGNSIVIDADTAINSPDKYLPSSFKKFISSMYTVDKANPILLNILTTLGIKSKCV